MSKFYEINTCFVCVVSFCRRHLIQIVNLKQNATKTIESKEKKNEHKTKKLSVNHLHLSNVSYASCYVKRVNKIPN